MILFLLRIMVEISRSREGAWIEICIFGGIKISLLSLP